MLSKVRFGIVGVGAIARSHVAAIRQVPEAELVAICRRTKDKADELGRKWEAKEIYYNYGDLVRSKSVDAIIVSTPNVYHREAVIAAAREGKHVLCEKPIATNLKDAREMVTACKKNNVKLQIGFNQRFFNQVKIAKQLVDEGTIGEVKSLSANYREKWDFFPGDTDYRWNFELSGGATLIDLIIHRIDMARWFLGDIEGVYAEIKHSVIPQKIDDNVWLLCNFENGVIGCFSSDRYSPIVTDAVFLYGTEGIICLNTETSNPYQSVPLAVYTEKSSENIPEIVLEYFYPTFWLDKPERSWISIVPRKKDSYLNQLRAFCQSIIEDKEPPVTGEDGIKALEVVLAAYKSAREKRRVQLPIKEEIVEPPRYE